MPDPRKQAATADEVDALKVLISALGPFRAENPTMPVQLAFTFLTIATDEGHPCRLRAQAGDGTGRYARNLLDLGEYNRRREPGLMLIEDKFDRLIRWTGVFIASS
jgi:hypothetical protein